MVGQSQKSLRSWEIWPGQHYSRREKGTIPIFLPMPQLWGNSHQKFGSQPSAARVSADSHSQDGLQGPAPGPDCLILPL